jgi:DNA polymerase III epsilon subunit-like protein
MRQIVLDTETTGLEPRDGHRIIEIGALEIVGRRIVEERRLHLYSQETPTKRRILNGFFIRVATRWRPARVSCRVAGRAG